MEIIVDMSKASVYYISRRASARGTPRGVGESSTNAERTLLSFLDRIKEMAAEAGWPAGENVPTFLSLSQSRSRSRIFAQPNADYLIMIDACDFVPILRSAVSKAEIIVLSHSSPRRGPRKEEGQWRKM